MNNYFNDFVRIINNINKDNTYKAAWGRAIVECVKQKEYEQDGEFYIIYEYNLVQKLMKYYWNQLVFFNLSQGPMSNVEQRINELRDEYYSATKVKYPVWYDKIEAYLKRNPVRMEKQIKKYITLVNKTVAIKFEKVDHENLHIYEVDLKQKCLRFNRDAFMEIKENRDLIDQVIDYKWAQLVEEYNKAHNIIKKVIGSKEHKLQKPGHLKIRNQLIEYVHLQGIYDFYTGEHLTVSEIALDYVIPYYFIYSSDIWNLVITSKEEVKKRRGMFPKKQYIDKLKERNKVLLESMENTRLHAKFEVEAAVNNHLIDRYYRDLKA